MSTREPARPPQPFSKPDTEDPARAERLAASEAREGRSLLRGLLLLALVVLAFSLARAGVGRAFVSGWWKQW